jgi:serine/threonine protein kinase
MAEHEDVSRQAEPLFSESELARLLRLEIPGEPGDFNQENLLALTSRVQGVSTTSNENTNNHEVETTTAETELQHLFGILDPPQEGDELARFGDYRLTEILGIGGMGFVFRAEDMKLGRQVAIKFVRPARLKVSSVAGDLLNEARAAAKLDHDNIVTVFQVGQHRDLHYLVMQLLSGQSLAELLRRNGPLSVTKSLEISRQLAQALAAAHRQNILHRDIKPDNIWLEASTDRVKILDFGLAQFAVAEPDSTDHRLLAGTPNYMAPERIRGEPGDHRADLYSTGIVLYEMLSGTRPFQATDTTQILVRGASWEPRALDDLTCELDPAISQLVDDLLEKDPNRRPGNAVELIRRIDVIAGESGKSAGNPSQISFPPRYRWGLALMLATTAAIALPIWRQLSPHDKRQANDSSGEASLISNRLVEPDWQLSGAKAWSLETRLHRGPASATSKSQDGTYSATGGSDGTIRLWRTADWNLDAILLGHREPVSLVEWTPDSTQLITVSASKVVLWDVARRRKIIESDGKFGSLAGLHWLADGNSFVVHNLDGTMEVRSIDDLSVYAHADSKQIVAEMSAVKLNPLVETERDSAYPVTYGFETSVNQFPGLNDFCFSSDGKRLAIAGDKLEIWNVETGTFDGFLTGFRNRLSSLSWRDRDLVVGCKVDDWHDPDIYLLEPDKPLESSRTISTVQPDGKLFPHRVFSEDGRKFAGVSDSEFTLVDAARPDQRRVSRMPLKSGEKILSVAIGNLGVVAVLLDRGRQMAPLLRVADPNGWKTRFEIEVGKTLIDVQWSPDDARLVTRDLNDSVRVWSGPDGQELDLVAFSKPAKLIRWAPDSKKVAVLDQEHVWRIWDLESDKLLSSFRLVSQPGIIRWHPSGNLIAIGESSGEIVLRSVFPGKQLARLVSLPDRDRWWIQSDGQFSSRENIGQANRELVVWIQNQNGAQDVVEAVVFNPSNGHHYEFVPAARIDWQDARSGAGSRKLVDPNGQTQTGYLATVTSAEEQDFLAQHFGMLRMVWLGGTDEQEEGQWRWVTGPEGLLDDGRGLLFWQGGAESLGGKVPLVNGRDPAVKSAKLYANWIGHDGGFRGEPNNLFQENYLIWNHAANAQGVKGQVGLWNDQMNNSPREGDIVSGYLVEYGE